MPHSVLDCLQVFIYSTHHEPAPGLDAPIVESNAEGQIRPIFKKCRKVRGKTGWLLRRYGQHFGAPTHDPEAVAHHALQIGPYAYEVTREKGIHGQRLSGDLMWPSTIQHCIVGYTDLTDEEIQIEGEHQ